MKKFEKKKANNIVILSTVIVVITLIMGLVFIYIPFLNRIKSMRAGILEERDKNVLVGKIRALGRHLKIYNKKIPEYKNVSWLLRELSDMAAKEKIEITSIKPGAAEDRSLYTRLYVVMDTLSTYHQLARFVSMVECSDRFLRIESIDIKRIDLEEGFEASLVKFKPFDVKSHIVIGTFFLKE